MNSLSNFLKKFSLPKFSIGEILKTSNMASAYSDNNFKKINKLLSKGKYYYKSVKFRENNNYSLLHQSICDNNWQVIDLILKQSYAKDSDVIEDVNNELGFAPVHLACLRDDVGIVKDLIERGHSRTQIQTNNDNLNLMHVCAQFGSLQTLEFVHKNYYKTNINSTSEEGWTPLHFSCFMNKFDISSYLIDNDADLYFRNKQHLTPIETSILNDNFELFFSLLNFHYDLNKLYSYDTPESAKLIHIAASCKKGTRILEYLLSDPNNLHEICNESIQATPLHFACMQNNINAVRLILRYSPNINMVDYLGNTPTNYAVENGNLEIIRMLYEAGADFKKKNNEGLNALQIAVNGDNKNVKLYVMGLEKYKNISLKDLI